MMLNCSLSRNRQCGSHSGVLGIQTFPPDQLLNTLPYANKEFSRRMKAIASKDLNLWPVESWKHHILQLVYLNMSVPALGSPVTICPVCVCCRCLEVSD